MFKVDPALFSSAENDIILGIKELENLKKSMNECALSFPDSYEYTKDVTEVFLKICNLHFDSDELLNKVIFAKKKLCELDKGFALTYYACALQNYAEVSGELTLAQEEYIKYSQSQYYDLLYDMLEDNKDNLTPEQAEIYNALKEQKEIEKKYEDLQKLYQEKEDNNGFWHPIIENDINKKIANLEKELGIYENKWYEDIRQAISKTGAEWSEGFSCLFAGEGFGELWDATKQTFATGAVVSRSIKSGVAKLGELILVDGVSLIGGSLASGATWLFHDIWTDNDLADNVMDSTLDFVRRDLVGEANTNFYENTSFGNWLNSNSNLKYDSAGAKAIQTGSEFVGKIVLATAATVATGGMAAPIALGALYGTGKATERYTQSVDRSNGEEYSYDKALGKALAGAIGGSAEFYGYGRMGSAIYNGLSGLGSSATSSATQASTSALKNFKKNFFEVDTLLDSSAVVADHGIDFLTGDKSFDEMLKSGGKELLLALGLNAVGAGISAKLETRSALKSLDSVGEKYFKPAGDLSPNSHFKPAGDLDIEMLKTDIIKRFDEYDKFLESNTGYLGRRVNKAYGVDQHITNNVIYFNEDYADVLVNKLAKKGMKKVDAVKFLEELDSTGACSYASVCNEIFVAYRNNSSAFARDFGFEMYYKSADGSLNLNTPELLSDIYLYVNDSKNKLGGKIFKTKSKFFGNDTISMSTSKGTLDTGNQIYLSIGSRNNDAINSYLQSKNKSLKYNSEVVYDTYNKRFSTSPHIIGDADIDKLKNSLINEMENGKELSIDVYPALENSENLHFFNVDGFVDTSVASWIEVDAKTGLKRGYGHSVFVSAIDNDGLWVSSWGKKLLLKWDELKTAPFYLYLTEIGGI